MWLRTSWELLLPSNNTISLSNFIVKYLSISSRTDFPIYQFHCLIRYDYLIFPNQVKNLSFFEWFDWTVQIWLCYLPYLVVMLCNWPPEQEVCINYEVVVFQPRTVTPPHLGSITNFTNFIYIPPAPPDSTIFWIVLVLPPSYPLPPAAVHRLILISVCTHFPPPLLSKSAAHLDVARTRNPSALRTHLLNITLRANYRPIFTYIIKGL